MKNTGLGRILAVVAVLGLLAAGLLLTLLPSGSRAREPSVLSAEAGGWRALFLLLEGLGYRTAVWTKTPGNLPRSRDVLFLPAVPEEPPGTAELVGPPEVGQESVGAPAGVRRMRDPRHYLRFVEEGGTIVLSAREEELGFLASTLELDEFFGLYLSEDWETSGPGTCVLASGEELELGDRGVPIAGDPADLITKGLPERAEVIAHDVLDVPLVVRVPIGRGSFVLVAPPPEIFDNASIDEHDHALFAVRLVEELRPEGALLFDEYALGGWVPESPLALALAPGTIVFSAHLIALLLVLTWRSAWTRAFPRDPEPLHQVSALARARGFAATLAREGRWSLLARILRSGVLARLMQRRRLAGARLEVRDEEIARPELEAALVALFRHDEGALARARTAFLRTRVTDAEELERLGAELRALERSLEAPAAPSERRPRARTTMLALR